MRSLMLDLEEWDLVLDANTSDRFFLRVMQYGAGTAENPPDRTGAQVDMTVWTVI